MMHVKPGVRPSQHRAGVVLREKLLSHNSRSKPVGGTQSAHRFERPDAARRTIWTPCPCNGARQFRRVLFGPCSDLCRDLENAGREAAAPIRRYITLSLPVRGTTTRATAAFVDRIRATHDGLESGVRELADGLAPKNELVHVSLPPVICAPVRSPRPSVRRARRHGP